MDSDLSELEQLQEAARAWATADPDPLTAEQLRQAAAAGDIVALRAALEHPLTFGTAGLRSSVGPGPGQMNLAIVSRFAWALAQFLKRHGLASRGVVVGFDARPHSESFAQRIAQVLAAWGVHSWISGGPLATPLVAHAARHLAAASGVVVTASHNPRGDNGVKVYDDLGIQIVAPWDSEIQALLREAPADPLSPLRGSHPRASVAPFPEDCLDAYFSQLERRVPFALPERGSEARFRVAYTPLHGVGAGPLARALRGAPVELHPVPSQLEPDGTFPTVPFPNPEEPGALDALLDLARRDRCELALAHDPDADRVAVAVPGGPRGWSQLSGDDVGLLLADAAWRRHGPGGACAASIVSSPGLESLAARRGGRVLWTLTGFKWIARAAQQEPDCIFGYEEALGYCFSDSPDAPRDKDGIAAAVHLCQILIQAGSGQAFVARLARIYREIGLWVSVGVSLRFAGAGAMEQAAGVLARLRSVPPTHLGDIPLTCYEDFSCDAEHRPGYLGSQDLLSFGAPGRARVLVRPSGTEPKVKFYVHLRAELGPEDDFFTARTALAARAQGFGEQLRDVAAASLPA